MKERRRTLRYPFVATAELVDDKSQTHLSARVTELSLFGCYFDTINPFPVSTVVVVKIVHQLVFFEARGRVVYSQPRLGIGVTFEQVHPYFLPILQSWLRNAEKARLESTQPTNKE
jgi:hypothetical protein